VNGEAAPVLKTESDHFCSYEADGPHQIKITIPEGAKAERLSPMRQEIPWVQEGQTVTAQLPGPGAWCLQCSLSSDLFIYANPPEVESPDPTDPKVRIYAEGSFAEEGLITLEAGETLYLEGGAMVVGGIRASKADGVRILGPGVLHGGRSLGQGDWRRTIVLEDCSGVQIRNLVIIDPAGWMVTMAGCRDSEIIGLKEIGTCLGSDGIDIVGCQRMKIRNCCLRNGDDCLVVKSITISKTDGITGSHVQDVDDILFEDCILKNHAGGSAMEIGYELQCTTVSGITYRRIDVLGVHSHGSVFGIHNSDHAVVKDVRYEDVWVEHHYDKLIDFRIVKSRWGHTEEPGRVQEVAMERIHVRMDDYNWGYSSSLIGGWDGTHLIEGVTIKDMRWNGSPVLNADAMQLYTRRAEGVAILP
jgi:hypothetical protein